MDPLSLTRMIIGSIFVLFIPGFAWTFAFFEKNEIDAIERIALSFGLSIALVPLTIFYLNYLFTARIHPPAGQRQTCRSAQPPGVLE